MKHDFVLPQKTQFDRSINLFYLVLTQEFVFTVFFLQLTSCVCMFFAWSKTKGLYSLYDNIFLKIYYTAFDFIVVSGLNANPNNLNEILSVRVFLVGWLDDCLMYLNILLTALKILKASLSR